MKGIPTWVWLAGLYFLATQKKSAEQQLLTPEQQKHLDDLAAKIPVAKTSGVGRRR
jgi:hypothetical protein